MCPALSTLRVADPRRNGTLPVLYRCCHRWRRPKGSCDKKTQKNPEIPPDPTPRERFANRQWGSMGLRVQLACKHKDRKRRGKRKRVEIRGRTHPSHHHSHRYSPEHYVGRAKGSGSGRESALTRRGKWRQAQPGDYCEVSTSDTVGRWRRRRGGRGK